MVLGVVRTVARGVVGAFRRAGKAALELYNDCVEGVRIFMWLLDGGYRRRVEEHERAPALPPVEYNTFRYMLDGEYARRVDEEQNRRAPSFDLPPIGVLNAVRWVVCGVFEFTTVLIQVMCEKAFRFLF